ncbi:MULTISPECIES: TspO/MBR family protein [Rhizobium/Agrobacterium group]|jgi:benzodiazapine receptor|uniref:Tryptophan-rich sensory protein n=1 Tax=Neorhizobium petrolearium TaxID=515361 RepID=A0ABY8M1T8_9HYPH|nr:MULTISPECIES: TspO/MBR family protein [Rhizobium/Agrobacterium group]KGD86557.1 CrtK/TspO family sensor protein [Rhizobium sp. YS-1r]MCC2613363.1 tryptophan-rich sensory protein [Neorhizobium petrolearium]WGI68444.1 tryptophan-rich sensory protein [Neorhizobium petrolearium]
MNVRAGELGSLFLFLALVLGGGLVIGFVTAPGAWYAPLSKPPFNPPSWVFAPVWTALYIMIAIAGWRVWRGGRSRAPMKLWWVQLVLNFAWSPIFFSAHCTDIALGVIVLLLITIIGFIVISWQRDKIASLLFAPYAAWVAFASVLNGAIWLLN